MADFNWQSILGAVWPFGRGPKNDQPLVADPNQLRNALAYVDPSRLFGGQLTLPYNPSVLATRKGLNIFDQMKLDEQVKSALLFKKHAVLASGWEVVSPGDQDAEWEVTKLVRQVFEALPGGMQNAMRSLLLGIDYGYALVEKQYGDGTGVLAGKLTLSRLISAKPHYFDFAVDAHGQVLMLLQKYVPGHTAGGQMLEFPPDKFVVYTHDKEFENPYGRSDLEAAFRAWWSKNNAYKWLLVALERYGMPPLFLMYNPNTYQDTQVGELKKIVKGIQNATMGLIPRGQKDDLEFWHAELGAQAKEVFITAIAHFDSDIAKALLQPSLTGFSGEGGGSQSQSRGSLARANVSWKAFMYVVEEIQAQLATVVNEQIVRQLCDLNFPSLQSYPQFKFQRLDDETQLELFRTWLAMVEGNVVNRITDDETHIRAALGFPENASPVIESLPERGTAIPLAGAPDVKVLAAEQVSDEMRAFAEEHGGEWRMVDGQIVCTAVEVA